MAIWKKWLEERGVKLHDDDEETLWSVVYDELDGVADAEELPEGAPRWLVHFKKRDS